ncbi:MAG: VWA domain-containing protein [Thermoanaerobaculia bacterium]
MRTLLAKALAYIAKPLLALALLALPSAAIEDQAQTPAPAQAQTPEEPAARFGEKVRVMEVLVDVLATTRRGRLVTGLTADDFLVEEDGEPREVTSATFYATRYEDLPPDAVPPGDDAPPLPEGFPPPHLPASRYFIFFFHDQSLEIPATNQGAFTAARLRAARDARAWLETEMGPSDWVAVLRYDHRLMVQSDFTQDRQQILDAVDSATMNQRTRTMRPSVRDRREALRAGPSLTAGLPNSFSIDQKTKRVEHAIRLVAEASRTIIGRKNLVLFTVGFAHVDSLLGSPDERYYPAMEAALNNSNVAVYPIDLAGSGNQSAQSNFLSQLADETGGIYFSTFHRFLDPLRDIGRYNTGYYLVSFRTEVPTDETGYRNFTIRAQDKKVRVRARRGYRYAPAEE